jgi:hypothetical protein
MQTLFERGNLEKTENFEYLDTNARIILKLISKAYDGKAQTIIIWLRIGKIGGLL